MSTFLRPGALASVTVVFDLDGTLVDTAPDLLRALNETLDLEAIPHAPAGALRQLVGQGARALIARGAGLHGVRFSEQRLDELTEAFIRFYRADIARHSRPFPGVEDALSQLAGAGAKLAVCTNKRTDLSVALLTALRMERWFSAIVGADAVPHQKPHPDHFREAVARAGGQGGRAIMIGDSSADIGAARAAGAPAVLVSFGYSDVAYDQLAADLILTRYADLPAAVVRLTQ